MKERSSIRNYAKRQGRGWLPSVAAVPSPKGVNHTGWILFRPVPKVFDGSVIPGRCESIEPGISRFPDAQLRICGLVLAHHPGMTEVRLREVSSGHKC